MKRYLILLVGLSALRAGFTQTTINPRSEIRSLITTIQQYHYNPRALNDDFSRDVYADFLAKLDPEQLYFTEEDLRPIEAYELMVDDLVMGTDIRLLDEIVPVYKKALERSGEIIQSTTAKPFNFNIEEEIENRESASWARNENDNREYWRKWLKYETLNRMYVLNKTNSSEFSAVNERVAREKVKAIETRSIDKILQHSAGLYNYVAVQFFKAIAGSFDAHTAYLSGAEVQNFIGSLSTENLSFGISLKENDHGDVTIVHVVPGGPAWSSGEVNAMDVLVRIKTEGDATPVDVAGEGIEMVSDILQDTTGPVALTVRKQNGVETTVVLRKEKMHVEENVVKSFVLHGERTIGYITLPGFYTDWGDEEGSQCANDVAKEILKLKRENIDGIILDVRFNGGGSLQEAIAMAGIFIDEGSLGIIQNKSGQLISTKDPNRGSVYDGPMLLMVNGQSASASEFLAAALQDYNRAIIVGSQTFGKATGQQIVSLAPNSKGKRTGGAINYNYGFLNVTELKIYRVTGKTAQCIGVAPHITLPDYFDKLEFRESTLPYVITADSVNKNTYFRPLQEIPLAEIRSRSRVRVDASKHFQFIQRFGDLIARKVREENKAMRLTWSGYHKEVASFMEGFHQLDQVQEMTNSSFMASPLKSEEERMKIDSYLRDFNMGWVKKLQSDVYVDEAFHILCDYISITSKK